MEEPTYFFNPALPWASWRVTQYYQDENKLMIGNEFFRTGRSKAELEIMYPGFVQAVDMLAKMGCNSLQCTSVLKFCIIHANGSGLNSVLMCPRTLALVSSIVSLGLSDDELASALAALTLDAKDSVNIDGVSFT